MNRLHGRDLPQSLHVSLVTETVFSLVLIPTIGNERYYLKAEYDQVREKAQTLTGDSLSAYQDERRLQLEARREVG